jgi:hypothetical protein
MASAVQLRDVQGSHVRNSTGIAYAGAPNGIFPFLGPKQYGNTETSQANGAEDTPSGPSSMNSRKRK